MKTVSIKEANYSLYNSDNFKKELECDIEDAIEKLSILFVDYLIYYPLILILLFPEQLFY
jgi:hypothetical protein